MATSIDFDPRGFRQLGQRIDEIQDRINSLEPVLKGRAETLRSLITDNFSKSESPWGESWEPLAASTIKQRRGGSSKPLIDTGQLRGSITTRAEGNRIRFGVSGNAAVYARAQQLGTEHIPARPFLPIRPSTGRIDFEGGRAQQWMDRVRDRVIRYVLTGKK